MFSTLMVLLQATQEVAEQAANFDKIGAAFGACLTVFAAAWGIGRIGSKALEATARQPEAAGDIRSNMIVSAALIEGVAFFAVVVCLLILFV